MGHHRDKQSFMLKRGAVGQHMARTVSKTLDRLAEITRGRVVTDA